MSTEQPVIRPRTPPVSFEESIPRHWLADAAVPTHLVNGVNLLFPAGERFFIRSVRRYADRIDDPDLQARIRGFFGQEGWHANAHEKFFGVLRAQGYRIDGFIRFYRWVAYGILERAVPAEVRLSITVALEHFTAIMAENALRDGLLEQAHPELRGLLLWHAAEEIEHKSVAFDVLKKVNPSYGLRMVGLGLASALLGGFWAAATALLLLQDAGRGGTWRVRVRPGAVLRDHSIVRHVFLRGIREYLRRDFHPSDNDTFHLAEAYLAGAGIA